MNKVIAITGATSGFGEAMAKKFGIPGYKLVLAEKISQNKGRGRRNSVHGFFRS